MPIPFLPLDIIVEIISHLEEEEEGEDGSRQIKNGKAVSLVRRSWKPIGQGLRWKVVKTMPSQFSSLIAHFDEHPHLAKLIREFKLYCPSPTVYIDVFSFEEATYRKMPKFLKKAVNLQSLSISGNIGKHLVKTFKASSKLRRLLTFQVFLFGEVEWSNQLASSFQTGFAKLSSFGFEAVSPTTTTLFHGEEDPSIRKLSLENLKVAWTCEPSTANQLVIDFFSVLDPSTLKSAALLDLAVCTSSVEWLSTCPHLLKLSLSLSITENLEELSQFLSILPRFRSLQRFRVDLLDLGDDDLVEPHVTLLDVIAKYPPSLKILEAKQFVFSDSSSLPIRHCPSDDEDKRKYIFTLCPSDEEEGVAEKMLVWGEDNQGKISWYRHVLKGTEEEEEGGTEEEGEGQSGDTEGEAEEGA
ncbi:hypothetical protein JCM3765_007254 [Sporobolomyces pararoseus]